MWRFILSIKKTKRHWNKVSLRCTSEQTESSWESCIASVRCVFRCCLVDRPCRVTHVYGAAGLICPETLCSNLRTWEDPVCLCLIPGEKEPSKCRKMTAHSASSPRLQNRELSRPMRAFGQNHITSPKKKI